MITRLPRSSRVHSGRKALFIEVLAENTAQEAVEPNLVANEMRPESLSSSVASRGVRLIQRRDCAPQSRFIAVAVPMGLPHHQYREVSFERLPPA